MYFTLFCTNFDLNPGHSGPTEVTYGQTILERLHFLGALELQVVKKAQAHFRLDNDQEFFWSVVISVCDGLTRGTFERTLLWSEAVWSVL